MLARRSLVAFMRPAQGLAMARFNSTEAPAAKESKESKSSKDSSSWAVKAETGDIQQGMGEYDGIQRAIWVASGTEKRQIASDLLPSFEDNQTTYEPSDFSYARSKLSVRQLNRESVVKNDRFQMTNIDPLLLWKEPATLSQYITANGKIMPGYVHGTKGKNHKKLAKAIRRCRAAGLLSTVHRSVDQI